MENEIYFLLGVTTGFIIMWLAPKIRKKLKDEELLYSYAKRREAFK